MTCARVRQAFSDLYDERLSGPPLVTITQHLATCQECRAEWAAFRKAMQAVADLGQAEPSPGFAARVRRRMEAPSRLQPLLRWLFLPLRVKVPIQAMALLAAAVAGLLLYGRSPDLRREAEFRPAAPPPAAREAPDTAPPPAAPPLTKAPASPSSPPRAGLEPERDRAASALRDEAKPLGKPTPPAQPPKREESSRELRSKTAEPGVATGRLRQAAPAPERSGGAVAPAPPAPRPLAAPPSAPGPGAAPAPGKETQTFSLPSRSADELYATALQESARQRYHRSIDEFRAFIAQHPGDARLPDARLHLADAYVAQRRHSEAVQEYETLIREHPGSPLLPTALYRLGRARLDLGDESGCETLRDLTTRYPQAPEATLARETLSVRCP